MRNIRLLALAVLSITVLIASYMTLLSLGLLGSSGGVQVKSGPAGHQEVAVLLPATSGEAWERLVAAVKALQADWDTVYPNGPHLQADYHSAFLPLTVDIPEIAIEVKRGNGAKLWIRWYKLSSEGTAQAWVDKLAERAPPPLAIIGGDTSERANRIARVLEAARDKWRGVPPLFLITTATADRVFPDVFTDTDLADETLYPKLSEIYQNATFRFSFTNSHMTEAVLDFVKQHAEVWPEAPLPAAAAASVVGQADPLAGLSVLNAHLRPIALFIAAWTDDPYSRDIGHRFKRVFETSMMSPSSDPPLLEPINYG